ncbi:MAG TPA: hypothetical protein VFW98_05190 [Gemmatimonadaceae bacterium]|nr:hypothetical protein [Gemmatimonadaceae bacterium]
MAHVTRWMARGVMLAALGAMVACGSDNASGSQGPYAKQVAEAIPTIERITGLRFKKPPVVQERTKDQVHQYLQTEFKKQGGQELDQQAIAYKMFGLIPDSMHLRSFMLALLTEQVAGYYDPDTQVLYIVKGAPRTMVTFTIQHELVHALQDQYMDLDSILNIHGDDDRQIAAQSVMEGQATLVPIEAAAGGSVDITKQLPGVWDRIRQMIRQQNSAMPLMAGAPLFIQESALFPYLSGAEFIHQFNQRNPGKQPYGKALPASTEQVMHPAAYFGATRDAPTYVTLPAPRTGSSLYQNDLGEFSIRVLIYQQVQDQSEATRAAAGWDGDRYMVVKTPKGDGVAWLSIWDTQVDAAQFQSAMETVITHLFGGPTARTTADGSRHYQARGRSVLLWGGTVQHRPAVLYVDMPAGEPTDMIDLKGVRLDSTGVPSDSTRARARS